MDKKITNNTVLGAFVLVAFTIFLLLVFNMGGGQGVFARQYTLYAQFRNVKGLHYGSEISLSGLRIGTVKGISISKENNKELIVTLSISTDVKNQLKIDSEAKIVTQGVLGDKYIEVSIGSPDAEPLKDGDHIRSSETEDIFSKGTGLVEELKTHFGKGSDVDSLLKNLSKVAQNLAVLTTEAQKGKGVLYEVTKGNSGEKLNKSLASLESILRKIDSGEGTVGGLINDPTVYEDLKSVLGGAKRSTILKYFMNQFRDSGEKPPAANQKK